MLGGLRRGGQALSAAPRRSDAILDATVITPAIPHMAAGFGAAGVALLVNGLLNALSLPACALFSAGMPVLWICLVLFVGGMTRSMQFTAFNTIAFADVPREQMNPANTRFSTAFPLARDWAWRWAPSRGAWASGWWARATGHAVRVAVVIVGLVSLLTCATACGWRTAPAIRWGGGPGRRTESRPSRR
ncbi:transporter [Bordetella ansorpii]|uniref:Transporter n=1 Tax=Bordetella ansorpii TaxID=288768 RepID=A0A157RAG7_9BORD|nr:hypothetical protein [Bordetella ansorpii]SAI55033.1 transporter [Bordetella ansorpii]